jgi:hypothetical protein
LHGEGRTRSREYSDDQEPIDWEFTKVIVEKSDTHYVNRNGSMSVIHGVVRPTTSRYCRDIKKRRNDTSRIRTCAPKGK